MSEDSYLANLRAIFHRYGISICSVALEGRRWHTANGGFLLTGPYALVNSDTNKVVIHGLELGALSQLAAALVRTNPPPQPISREFLDHSSQPAQDRPRPMAATPESK